VAQADHDLPGSTPLERGYLSALRRPAVPA
jgi:hypothetical protein